MKTLRLTKNELKSELSRLLRLEQYLPTLKLKKALLQSEVDQMIYEHDLLKESVDSCRHVLSKSAVLFELPMPSQLEKMMKVKEIGLKIRNVAGMELKFVENVTFEKFDYAFTDTPIWWDAFIQQLRDFKEAVERLVQVKKNIKILQKELRSVSLRVSLFEKNLIPRTIANIKKIKVFLEDQAIATLGQIKVAKKKLQMKKDRGICEQN